METLSFVVAAFLAGSLAGVSLMALLRAASADSHDGPVPVPMPARVPVDANRPARG